MPARASHQALSHGYSRRNFTQYSCLRKPIQQLENLSEFAQNFIHIARILHADDTLSGLDISDPVYALDSSAIDLCLSLFPWAQFRKTKGAIKLHTLLDLHSNIPTFLSISDGKLHDVNSMDFLLPEAEAFYIMDRAYLDFERLHRLHLCGIFFVLRNKSITTTCRLNSNPVDRNTGFICDKIVKLSGISSKTRFP